MELTANATMASSFTVGPALRSALLGACLTAAGDVDGASICACVDAENAKEHGRCVCAFQRRVRWTALT